MVCGEKESVPSGSHSVEQEVSEILPQTSSLPRTHIEPMGSKGWGWI